MAAVSESACSSSWTWTNAPFRVSVVGVLQKAIDEGLLRKDIDPLEAGVILWSNSNGMMRLMDRQEEYWKQHMGLDLEKMLRNSNRMLVEGMMTEEAKKILFGQTASVVK